MNVVPYTVQVKAGWVPQIRYYKQSVTDRLGRDVEGEVIWETLAVSETPEEAIERAQDRIDARIAELFG